MRNKISKQTARLTLCAVCTALGVVILTLGALIDVLDLSAAAFAGIVTVLIVIEIGGWWPWLTWAATGLLAVLLLPNKLPGVMYLLFCGWYPIVKQKLERIRLRPLVWLLKLVIMNAAMTLIIVVSKYILQLPDDVVDWSLVLYLLANGAFVLFDIALTKIITLYLLRLRKRFGFDNRDLRG